MKEETNLDVRVLSLLLDAPGYPGDIYQQLKTHICKPFGGEAKPGYDPEYDPEVEAAGLHGIQEVKWFELRIEADWDFLLFNAPLTYLPLQLIRRKLGYLV